MERRNKTSKARLPAVPKAVRDEWASQDAAYVRHMVATLESIGLT